MDTHAMESQIVAAERKDELTVEQLCEEITMPRAPGRTEGKGEQRRPSKRIGGVTWKPV